GDWAYVLEEIKAVVGAVGESITTKVIIETSLLTDDEKRKASEVVKESGADFVKTSTGFSTGGATLADVKLMREAVGPDLGVKASGGVSKHQSLYNSHQVHLHQLVVDDFLLNRLSELF